MLNIIHSFTSQNLLLTVKHTWSLEEAIIIRELKKYGQINFAAYKLVIWTGKHQWIQGPGSKWLKVGYDVEK
jgi:hypothetical protein